METTSAATFSLGSLEVCGSQVPNPGPGPWTWFGSGLEFREDAEVVPLRAKRSTFLSPWNNTDPHGNVWRRALPTDQQRAESEDEEEGLVPSVSVEDLRRRSSVQGRTVQKQLIVRVTQKSSLMFYGHTETNSTCPYKAVLQVCDRSGAVVVVLWNSVCLDWYLRLTPGDIISLRRFRVKPLFQNQDDIEISVNSRNPTALIRKLPVSSVSPQHIPPEPEYHFCTSAELRLRPHGELCDVIGLVTFCGRSQRMRSKDSHGAELFLEYRWLRLEDGSSDHPVMVKLFATSQPEVHRQLVPMSVVVCTRLKLVWTLDQAQFYLTNTSYTQIYCTGLGHHSQMSYRKLSSVKLFLKWLRTQDDGQVLRRALIGGFFMFPPPPVTMETFMKSRRVAPSVLQGAELQRELDNLRYRERRSFCFQATVSTVTHCHRGQEHQCLSCSLLPLSPCLPPGLTPLSSPCPGSSPRSLRSPSSSSSSPVSQHRPRLLDHTPSRTVKRKLFSPQSPNKRAPLAALRPEPSPNSVMLFEASLEFLQDLEDPEEDSASSSDITLAPTPAPPLISVAVETLPVNFDPTLREEQAIAMTLGTNIADNADRFHFAFEDYYSLRLQVLSGLSLDTLFLPHSPLSPAPPSPHSNSWAAILSHGAFSPHSPPPTPADLIAMATQQLSNRRLLCVLEACRLDADALELVLIRAFVLS